MPPPVTTLHLQGLARTHHAELVDTLALAIAPASPVNLANGLVPLRLLLAFPLKRGIMLLYMGLASKHQFLRDPTVAAVGGLHLSLHVLSVLSVLVAS